jgi:hypothetical protein
VPHRFFATCIRFGASGKSLPANSITVDSSGSVYAASECSAAGTTVSFGNGVAVTGVGASDFLVVKFNSAGVAQWAKG